MRRLLPIRTARAAFELAALEARLLYCLDHGGNDDLAYGTFGAYAGFVGPTVAATTTTTSTTTTTAATPALGGVPAYASNPAATVKLFLDFDGAPATSWGGTAVPGTPAYDQDADPTTFSAAELASIKEIWSRVAEKYSPFNIDVITTDPGSYPLGKVLRIVVGGDGAWTGGTYGGISYVNSFTTGNNTSWVFPAHLGNGNPKVTAEAIAHEAGHAFGLQHQSSYDANGVKTAEYFGGTPAVAPIMGSSYYSARGVWWNGTSSNGPAIYQDDMAVLARSINGFGYRADDHGDTAATADALTLSDNALSAAGIIGQTSDTDAFQFTTAGGTLTLSADVLAAGATLDLKLALYDSAGALVASADTVNLGESITATLPAGIYYLRVMSHGSYGDVGQYTIIGNVSATNPITVTTIAAPTNLTGATSATASTLSWLDNATNESGFVIQRSDDGGVTWSNLATLGANVTTYQDVAPPAGGSRQYRVYTFDASTTSAFSNVLTLWGAPAAPATLAAAAATTNLINLNWTPTSGATSYLLQRSSDGISWTQISNTAATSFQDTVAANSTYYYRVAAYNAGGYSAFSPVAAATTPYISLPVAPANLVATKIAKGKIRLAWADQSANETGFRIEYSTNATTWNLYTTVPAGATTYTAGGLRRGTIYYFRVCAYNTAGNSPYCSTANATASSAYIPVPTNKIEFSRSTISLRDLLGSA